LFLSLDEDLSLGLGLSLESDLLCLSELVRLSLSWFFRLSEVSLEWLLSRELFLEFTGVLSALISFNNVVIWYNLVLSLSDFLDGFSVCSHFLPCFFLGAVDSSISNCLVGDLALKEGDGCRRCLGPLLCFERDLLDDDGGVSSGGGGVFCLSADDSLDLSGELSWGEDCREGGLDDVDASDSEFLRSL
jgi:hypothetical protein